MEEEEEEGEALLFGESFAGSTLLRRSCKILSGFIGRAVSLSAFLLLSLHVRLFLSRRATVSVLH